MDGKGDDDQVDLFEFDGRLVDARRRLDSRRRDELHSRGLKYESEKPIMVRYRVWDIPGQKVDLIVGKTVLVELKAIPRLRPIHRSQVLSYLKTLNLRIGLLVNFNSAVLRDGFKRVIR